MLGIALALAASLSWGVSDFLGGLKSRTMSVLVVIGCSQIVGLASIALVALIVGKPAPSLHYVVLAMLSALCGTLGLVAFFRAMVVGKISVVVPIAAMAAAIPVVVGIARGDRPTALQALGMLVALVGAVLAAREPGSEGEESGRMAAGVALAVVSAVAIGGFLVAIDAASEGGAVWASLVNRATSATMMVTALLVVRPSLAGVRPNAGVLALIGILDVQANLLFALATTEGLLSLVAVAGSLYPVVTVLLARIVLRERVHRVQEIGVAAALGGVVLIAAG